MKILMLAPEPFFQPRGTPISVYFRLKALSDLGHAVTLVTYPLGENVPFPGLVIRRSPNLFRVRKIKIGPSPRQGPARHPPLVLGPAEGRHGPSGPHLFPRGSGLDRRVPRQALSRPPSL